MTCTWTVRFEHGTALTLAALDAEAAALAARLLAWKQTGLWWKVTAVEAAGKEQNMDASRTNTGNAAWLREHDAALAAGMQGLCEAVGKLSQVRDAARAALTTLPPDPAADRALLGLSRACDHLVEAVGDLPNEVWAALLRQGCVGGHELKARLAEIRAA